MKYTNTKKSILSKAALIALFLVTGYTYTNDNNEPNIENIVTMFTLSEKNLANLFNTADKTPYKNCVERFDSILRDFKRSIEDTTRGNTNDAITTSINDIQDYVVEHFSVLCNVFKKYIGKPSTYALDFSREIKREFNTEKIFTELVNKLKTLKCQALQADKKPLAKKVDYLMHLVQLKKKEWSSKVDLILFTGLTNRMQC